MSWVSSGAPRDEIHHPAGVAADSQLGVLGNRLRAAAIGEKERHAA